MTARRTRPSRGGSVTLRERHSLSVPQIEVPAFVADPDKVAAWMEQVEGLVPEALDALGGILKASVSSRGDSAKVSAARTVLEVLNLLHPSPAFAAQLVSSRVREITSRGDTDLVEMLRALPADHRERILREASEPPSPDAPPRLDVIDLGAAVAPLALESGDPSDEDPFE